MRHRKTRFEQCPIPMELIHIAALWYRDGYTCKAPGGYVREYNPFHPFGSRRGLVLQHRLVVERNLGRLLRPEEIVHHRDGNRSNNLLPNLELMASQTAHMRHEHQQRREMRDPGLIKTILDAAKNPLRTMKALTDISPHTIRAVCREHSVVWLSGPQLNEQAVRQALQGRSTEDAAELLGVHPQTLRNNFDHLLKKRRPPGYYDRYRTQIEQLTMAQAARQFGTHRGVIRKNLRRWKAQDAKLAESAPHGVMPA